MSERLLKVSEKKLERAVRQSLHFPKEEKLFFLRILSSLKISAPSVFVGVQEKGGQVGLTLWDVLAAVYPSVPKSRSSCTQFIASLHPTRETDAKLWGLLSDT